MSAVNTNRSHLRSYLAAQNLPESRIEQVMATLEKVFQQADSGKFTVKADPDVAAIKTAVARVDPEGTGFINRVDLIPALNDPKDDSMIDSYLWYGLSTHLWSGAEIENSWKFRIPLIVVIESLLMSGLKFSLRNSPRVRLHDGVVERIMANFDNLIHNYVALHLAGRSEEAEKRLSTIIPIMADNPVLCWHHDSIWSNEPEYHNVYAFKP